VDPALSRGTDLDLQTIARVGRLWRLRLIAVRPELAPSGSPDRCLSRAVAVTDDGRLVLIERLSPAMAPRKMSIAALLQELAGTGMRGVNPYLTTGDGHQVVPLGGDYWQISPFLDGAPLPRPGWVRDAWRGEALAGFLVELRAATMQVRLPVGAPYSPAGFCLELRERVQAHIPELAEAISAIVDHLVHEWLPSEAVWDKGFCHGDPHPLNVIWDPAVDAIRAVIDWEFCGVKPAAYDAALVIGCVGIEDPDALTGAFVRALLAGLRRGDHPAGAEPSLPALVLAIRFAWLSDWLRRGDEEMVTMERDYIRLLADRREELGAAWA
jgi:homoserine kinase type II